MLSDSPTPLRGRLVCENPPIIIIDNFLNATQVANVLAATKRAFDSGDATQSFQIGADGKPMLSADRTSSSVELAVNQYTGDVRSRALRLLAEPSLGPQYLETLQAVRYSHGQHFDWHHDAGTVDLSEMRVFETRADGTYARRAFTLFLYLNTVAEEDGGATTFPLAQPAALSIQPVAGRAVLWANTHADGSFDIRTIHRGSQVNGANTEKYAINVWYTHN